MDRHDKKELLRESKRSMFAKICLIELYVKEVEGITICIKAKALNPHLLNEAYKNARKHYTRELNSYTVLGRLINFIKDSF